MIDIIYLLNICNLVLNTFSTVFTLLFILYRFTSLFSYMIGFIKFCGKLIKGIFYIKNNIYYYTSGYSYKTVSTQIDEDADDEKYKYKTNSIFGKMHKYMSKMYHYVFPKKKEYQILPVYEIRESYISHRNSHNDNSIVNRIGDSVGGSSIGGGSVANSKSEITNVDIENNIEKDILNNQINQLMNEYDDDNDNNTNNNKYDDESRPFLQESTHNEISSVYPFARSYNVNCNFNKTINKEELLDVNKDSIMLHDIFYDCQDNYNNIGDSNTSSSINDSDDSTIKSLNNIGESNISSSINNSISCDIKNNNDNIDNFSSSLHNSSLYLNFDFIKKKLNKKNNEDDMIGKFQSLSL